MALPTVKGTLQVAGPAFIRKLRRRSDWLGQLNDNLRQRVKTAVEKLFLSQSEPGISIYLVNNDEDLRRVALGLNAGRDSLSEAVPFVAFLPSELAAANIKTEQTLGNLPCAHANCLHHDIVATEEQLTLLCEVAINVGRDAGNCSKGMMNDVISEAKKEGCRIVTQDGGCKVNACQPA